MLVFNLDSLQVYFTLHDFPFFLFPLGQSFQYGFGLIKVAPNPSKFLEGLNTVLTPLHPPCVEPMSLLSWPENIVWVGVIHRWGWLQSAQNRLLPPVSLRFPVAIYSLKYSMSGNL
jgi:hypothetical protein